MLQVHKSKHKYIIITISVFRGLTDVTIKLRMKAMKVDYQLADAEELVVTNFSSFQGICIEGLRKPTKNLVSVTRYDSVISIGRSRTFKISTTFVQNIY